MSAQPETILADRYRLAGLLGRGGMGRVYRAMDLLLGVEVALKVLPGGGPERHLARFHREAELMSRIHHPNVVRVLGSGDCERGLYLSLELVEGMPFSRFLQADLPYPTVVGVTCQLLEGLAEVHKTGVLHRDIKPDNVLISRDDDGTLCAKLTDFGIASVVGDDLTRITLDGTVVGTPFYMAPEQAMERAELDARADLYAVGVILYRFLTGTLPFRGTTAQVLDRKLLEEAPPPRPRPGRFLADGLSAAVRKLIARQPDHRFAGAREASLALLPFAEVPTLGRGTWARLGTPRTASTGPGRATGSSPPKPS